MSVVAARVYKDRIEIAADSILVRGETSKRTGFAKLTSVNNMLIGGVGECSELMLFLFFAKTHRPETPTETDVLALFAEFSAWKEKYVGREIVNSYLLACEGHLFSVEGLFVREVKDYDAIGAGEDFAIAALHLGHSPRDAVKTACELCCYVSKPISVEFMPLGKK